MKQHICVSSFTDLYLINVKTAEPIGAQILCGTSHGPEEGLWMIILKISLQQYTIFIQY